MKQYRTYGIILAVTILISIHFIWNREILDAIGKTKPIVFRHGLSKRSEKVPEQQQQQQFCRSRTPGFWLPGFEDEDNTDWPFDLTKTWECPHYYYNQPSTSKLRVALDCSSAPRLAAHSSSDIQIVQPGDECLHAFIRNCCYDKKLRVPNVLHYIWYSDQEVGFFSMVSFVAAIRFMKPCLILFHGPYVPRGQFWDFLVGVYPYVIIVNETLPTEIFGHKLKFKEHGADIMRIRAIQEYGGVYLDWDQILVKPIDILRTHSFTMSQEFNGKIGNQFILGEPNATFLTHYLNGYSKYSNSWAYNSIEVPFKLSKEYPDLINVLPRTGLLPMDYRGHEICRDNLDWSENYALHFYLRIFSRRHRMNMISIRHENSTLGAVCRRIMLGKKEMCKFTKF